MRVRVLRDGREVNVLNFERDKDAQAEFQAAMRNYEDYEVRLETDDGTVLHSVGPKLQRKERMEAWKL